MKNFIKRLIKSAVQDIFTEGFAQNKREMWNRIQELEEDVDRVEKNADRRYHEMRRVDNIIKQLEEQHETTQRM